MEKTELDYLKTQIKIYRGKITTEKFTPGEEAPDVRKIPKEIIASEKRCLCDFIKVVGGLRDWDSDEYFPFFILTYRTLNPETLEHLEKEGYSISPYSTEQFSREWNLDYILQEK